MGACPSRGYLELRETALYIEGVDRVRRLDVQSDRAVASRDRVGWFEIPRTWLEHLRGVPGVQDVPRRADRALVHLTHLPLLPMVPSAFEGRDITRRSHDLPAPEFDVVTKKLGFALRPYQHDGRRYIGSRRGTLLAWQMRTGKTPTIVCAADLLDGPLVVVAPLAARHVWLGWFKRRFPEITPVVIEGTKLDTDRLLSSPIVFMHYDILASWKTLGYLKPGMVVFDEAHLLSNGRASRGQAAGLLGGQAKRIVLATGTPIWNRPAQLYSLLHLVTPGAWGNYKEFTRRYANGHPGSFGWVAEGTSHEAELKARLTETMFKLSWEDVLDEVPETTRSVEVVPISGKDASRLDKLVEIARQDCTSFRRTTIGEIARLRRLLGNVKIVKAANLVARIADTGASVVVWVWHKEVGQAVLERLQDRTEIPAFFVSGDDGIKARNEILDRWRNLTGAALIMTLGVGQAGIDLSHAEHAVFVETDWTPAVVAQAEARIFVSDRPSAVIYVVADHPVDMAIVRTLVEKCRLAAQIGVPAAETAVDLLREALGDVDLEAVMSDVLATVFFEEEEA